MNPLVASLPTASDRRIALRVTPDAIRQIRGGHPWVFDRSIISVSHEGAAGDLAVVFDKDRQFVALGLYDPQSPIRLKVLHVGKPVAVDGEFWRQRILSAIELRRVLLDDPATTGMRLIHGDNDGLGGLVADRYDDVIVLKLYSAAWVPHLATIVPLIAELGGANTVVLRVSRQLRRLDLGGLREGMALLGQVPTGPVQFSENGLTFQADVLEGQKTGHFLDQRDNRQIVRAMSDGADVLDLFCCTGGFSVYAAAGGAQRVHSVDISAGAIATTKVNMAHNIARPAVERCEHRTTVGDAFDVMRDLHRNRRRFSLVVVDPPAFASKQSDRPQAITAYRTLTRLAVQLLENGGTLVQSSCSSRVTADEFFTGIHSAAEEAGARLAERMRTTHAIDHPIAFAEGAYLKTLIVRVDHGRQR